MLLFHPSFHTHPPDVLLLVTWSGICVRYMYISVTTQRYQRLFIQIFWFKVDCCHPLNTGISDSDVVNTISMLIWLFLTVISYRVARLASKEYVIHYIGRRHKTIIITTECGIPSHSILRRMPYIRYGNGYMTVITLCLYLLAKLFYTKPPCCCGPEKEEKNKKSLFFKSDKCERNYIVHSFEMKIKTNTKQ